MSAPAWAERLGFIARIEAAMVLQGFTRCGSCDGWHHPDKSGGEWCRECQKRGRPPLSRL